MPDYEGQLSILELAAEFEAIAVVWGSHLTIQLIAGGVET